MNPITIPKKFIKNDDLVIVSRKEYEEILKRAQKRTETELDRRLGKALDRVLRGKIKGPFGSTKALKASLEK